jgi:uncharacterized protein (TIGR00268 family)
MISKKYGEKKMTSNLKINTETLEKFDSLKILIKKLGKVAVAFSGGVDSTFLLKAAIEALGSDNVIAITVTAPYIPNWEVEESKKYTEELKVKHEFIKIKIDENIKYNPENRCYLCKKNIFRSILEKARDLGYESVVDGTNFDDLGDYRPGLTALKELEVLSPMSDLKISKNEIRELSKDLKLKTWNKPAYACLLTRIPHGVEITNEELERIEKSEKFLFGIGLLAVRVRSHGNLARIELGEKEKEVLKDQRTLTLISKELKGYGYEYVTADLDGYKMGSFNKLEEEFNG